MDDLADLVIREPIGSLFARIQSAFSIEKAKSFASMSFVPAHPGQSEVTLFGRQ